ncbi:phosphomannomutase [Gemmobacter straminiformis]|uniref:Phosphomannomutase n=1 Tax=Paragemmobacter straminiformis TaxID=2045119 RepID=A0A842I6B9_9RHOB|nr:phosphomannomutase [Gemmobacter straminiformis]MBC2835131.1 phosphomannomutase [Gemmobacter straminiformis]
MSPKFGTSGLRGLVTELTADLLADHIRAFLAACPLGTGLYVARDLRPSSPAIAELVIAAALQEGVTVTDCGAVPTPALALAAMGAGAAAVMVTGSHIPADRNGLKFYTPAGEITKQDEAAILAALGRSSGRANARLATDTNAGQAWVNRYVTAFGGGALAGRRIGVWSHSAVSRDLLRDALAALGALTVEVGRSDEFIPVDTEAVPGWARQAIRQWVVDHGLDALVSTDGDGDRPLLADERGEVIPGDILGQITARVLTADTVVTPLTSNTGAELSGHFARVIRTRIGSPFVIAGMAGAGLGRRVVGYEANGGFLLGFDACLSGPLPALATRDSLLPILATLVAAGKSSLSRLVSAEPSRFTAADRLENVDPSASGALVRRMAEDATLLDSLLSSLGEETDTIDVTDGLRVHLHSGRILHIRPSGNAPELRIYVEAEDARSANEVLGIACQRVGEMISSAHRED